MIQLCGGNNMHVKLSSNYYQLAECEYKWGKIDEAISQYKKSKNILEFNSYTKTSEYALIELKLATLNFSKYRDGECEKLITNSFNILKNNPEENCSNIIYCLELINRCTVDPTNKINLMNYTLSILVEGLEENYLTDDQSLKLGKILLEYYLKKEGK